MKYILLALLLTSCTTIRKVKCFSIDGKAYSWCLREYRAVDTCKENGGLDTYSFNYAKCRNGLEFNNIN